MMKEEILRLIPSLEGRLNKSVRVLPQKGDEPAVNATKLGGLFLWSKDEPWINCDIPEFALYDDYGIDDYGHIWPVSHPKHNDALLPILQLRKEDCSVIGFPGNKNILQLLWCPRDHPDTYAPFCQIVWKKEEDMKDQVSRHPEPGYPEEYDYFPSPSPVLLREVWEYPHYWELPEDVRNLLNEEQKDFYWKNMGPHEGIKIGGHVSWIQNPEVPVCACFNRMEYLLTVGSDVFEDYPDHKAPGLVIGDCGSIYVFICYDCEHLPVKTVFHCS